MGLFDGFSKAIKKVIRTEYDFKYVISDTFIFSDSIVRSLLFPNEHIIYYEYNNLVHQYTIAKENGNQEVAHQFSQAADNYILNTVKRIHYEQDLQYSQIQPVVYLAIGDFAQIIEIIQNIDGERSQLFFSGFTIQEQTAESLTQQVCQIISREYTMYLRDYLTNLDNLQHYAEYMNNSTAQGSGGSLLTGAMGGAAAFVNPLLGLGLIAKAVYDSYQSDQNEQAKIEKYYSLRKKWSESFFNLDKVQFDICSNISNFIVEKIHTAFNEVIDALANYCTEYNIQDEVMANNISNAVYQHRINYGKMPTFNDEAEKEIFIKLSNEIITKEDLHPDILKFYKNALQRLS